MKTCKRKYLKGIKEFKYKLTRNDGSVWYVTSPPSLTETKRDWVFTTEQRIVKVGFSKKAWSGKKDWRKSLRKIVD